MTTAPVQPRLASAATVPDTLAPPDLANMTALVVTAAGGTPGQARSMLTHAQRWVRLAQQGGNDAITLARQEVETPEYKLLERILNAKRRWDQVGGTTVIEALYRFLLGSDAREANIRLTTTRRGGRVRGDLALAQH